MEHSSEIISGKFSKNLEIVLTLAGIVFTSVATALLVQDMGLLLDEKTADGLTVGALEQGVFMSIVFMLIYGNIVYQLSRLGFLLRDRVHKQEQPEDHYHLFTPDTPAVTILVPSYKEELRVIHQTLMSAALQQYPGKRVVLLIDDPVNSKTREDAIVLQAARDIPAQIKALLGEPQQRYQSEYSALLLRMEAEGEIDADAEIRRLSALYADAAKFFEHQAKCYRIDDHTDQLFVDKTLSGPAAEHRAFERWLIQQANLGEYLDPETLRLHYRRLIAQFNVELSSFERKKYENLSHEANKAMNLNTYIDMIGKSFREVRRDGMLFLEQCISNVADLSVPDSKYLITLDADSLILQHYAARLVHLMEQPGNERLAVAQTPYSAIHGTDNLLERVAGATTDIQLLIHQGFTWGNATFWVGANALLRKEALEDIKLIEEERGYPVPRYIQDRTVIEDTESSIDLVDRGWSLYNYPARMAYSATPPDYGSLLIQRRRWANGGLIIMPKLLRHIARNISPRKLFEGFIRLHYLVSIAAASVGVLALIMYPFEDVMRSWWLPLSALPYFYLYGRDLKLSGYSWKDLPRVYALNLMLIPINLGGVLKSIQQAVSNEKIPFVRTPKVENRTASPPLYVILEFLLLACCLSFFVIDAMAGRWMHAAFSLVNGAFFFYACTYFVGWKAGLEDLQAAWQGRREIKDSGIPVYASDAIGGAENLRIAPSTAPQDHTTSMLQTARRPHAELRHEVQDRNLDVA